MPLNSLVLDVDLIRDKHTIVTNVERFYHALLQEACMMQATSLDEENDDYLLTVTLNKHGVIKLVASLHQLVVQVKKRSRN